MTIRPKAFSLLELLTVMALISVLLLGTMGVGPVLEASKLDTAGALLADELKMGSQMAATENGVIELRLYKIPPSGGGAACYSAFRLVRLKDQANSDGTQAEVPVSHLQRLPNGIAIAEKEPFSNLIAKATGLSSEALPQLGGGTYTYSFVRFLPNGHAVFPNGVTGSNWTTSFGWLTVVPSRSVEVTASSQVANRRTVVVDATRSTVEVHNP